MQNTMNLLEAALKEKTAAEWHKKLNLSRNALHTAKLRGHLSPAIAGALAEELGEDVEAWMLVAALESERDSACKERMLRRFAQAAGVAAVSTALLISPGEVRAAQTGAEAVNADPICIMLRRLRSALTSRKRGRMQGKKKRSLERFFLVQQIMLTGN